jgi:hypothetical protein
MHIDTKTMLMSKVDNYLVQMNIIYFAAKNCEVVSANNPKYKQHALASYIPLGSGENSVYISRMVSKKEFFKLCNEKREPLVVTSLTKPTILEKIKKMLK